MTRAIGEKKAFDKRLVHMCVVAVFILGFGYLPTFSTITPYGMKALGCFLGIIYGWVFVDMLQTALMVFVLVPFTGLVTANELIVAGFGNVVVMQVCFILMLFSVMTQTMIPAKITNRLLGMRICKGRPWIFFGVLVFAAWLVSMIAGGVVTIIIVFPLLITICKEYGIVRYGRTSTFLFMGVLLADCIGQMCIPVRGMPLILMAMYQAIDPGAIFPTGAYMVFAVTLTLLLCLGALLLMKFVLRVDLSALQGIDTNAFGGEQNKFTRREVFLLGVIVLVLTAMILQTTVPVAAVRGFLGRFGTIGFCFIGMMAVLLVKIEGKPLTTMADMAKGLSWDTLLTVAAMQPVLAFISSDEAGIKAMLADICGPVVAGLSPVSFCLFIIIICGLLTNVLNNAACCLMFFPLVTVYAPHLGLSAIGIASVLIIMSHVAFATPAASFYSLIAFGYTEWIKASSFMKYAFLLLIPLLLLGALAGYALQAALF